LFGKRLKKSREKAGLSVAELAESLNVGKNTIWRWEQGERTPSDKDKLRLAEILSTTVSYLIGETSEPFKAARSRRDYDLVEIPVISREHTACCGGGITAPDETSPPEETILISRRMLGSIDDLRPPYAERTDGSSMTSYGIPSESIVVINPGEEVRSGDVALVCLGGREAIKAVIFKPEEIELHSDKKTLTVTKDDFDSGWFQILGKISAIVSTPKHGL